MEENIWPILFLRANPNRSMVISEHQFNPMNKEVAHDCDYTNPSINTGYDARRLGIFTVGSSGAGPSTIKQFTHHSKIDQSTTYHESDEVDRTKVTVVVQGLKTNNTVNVADVHTYKYDDDDDDDDQPTQRQNQPSQCG